MLSKEQGHGQRIDLLVIKKLSKIKIPVALAEAFSRLNVFEIKGKGDTLGTDDYYKASGYVSQLIWMTGDRDEYTRDDVTLSFVTQARPVKLLAHLRSLKDEKGRAKIGIEKIIDGIYHISGETYSTRLIIMKEDFRMYENIFALFGTTEEEIVEKATRKQQEEIAKLSYENRSLNDKNRNLNDENSILRALLAEHNIPLPAQRV